MVFGAALAVTVCWVVPALLHVAFRSELTFEKVLFNFLGPLVLAGPALAIRFCGHALRTLGILTPTLPARESAPLVEQLSSNWDECAGYRAGVGV